MNDHPTTDDLPARLDVRANHYRRLAQAHHLMKAPDADLLDAATARIRELEARVEAAHDAICYLAANDGFAPDFGATGPWVDEYDAAMKGRDT